MTAQTTPRPLLDVHGLRVAYGGVVAVSDVDLQISEGTVFGLIGPNGAGKTSMVDALTGYTRPAAGSIVFAGRDISRLRPYRRARLGLARTFQSVELFDDLTVDENMLVASEHVSVGSALRDLFLPHRPPDRTGVDWAIGVCGLEDVVDRVRNAHQRHVVLGQRHLEQVGEGELELPVDHAADPQRPAFRRYLRQDQVGVDPVEAAVRGEEGGQPADPQVGTRRDGLGRDGRDRQLDLPRRDAE
ncbi:MAG: ATP-binding cassette domain-containing protein, partial [Solirubrobacteraceae bacterium]